MEIMLPTNPNRATIGRRIPCTTNWNMFVLPFTNCDRKWKGHSSISSELESFKLSPTEKLAMVKINITCTADILKTEVFHNNMYTKLIQFDKKWILYWVLITCKLQISRQEVNYIHRHVFRPNRTHQCGSQEVNKFYRNCSEQILSLLTLVPQKSKVNRNSS